MTTKPMFIPRLDNPLHRDTNFNPPPSRPTSHQSSAPLPNQTQKGRSSANYSFPLPFDASPSAAWNINRLTPAKLAYLAYLPQDLKAECTNPEHVVRSNITPLVRFLTMEGRKRNSSGNPPEGLLKVGSSATPILTNILPKSKAQKLGDVLQLSRNSSNSSTIITIHRYEQTEGGNASPSVEKENPIKPMENKIHHPSRTSTATLSKPSSTHHTAKSPLKACGTTKLTKARVIAWVEQLRIYQYLFKENKMGRYQYEALYEFLGEINSNKQNPFLTPEILRSTALARVLTRFRHGALDPRIKLRANEICKYWRSCCRQLDEMQSG